LPVVLNLVLGALLLSWGDKGKLLSPASARLGQRELARLRARSAAPASFAMGVPSARVRAVAAAREPMPHDVDAVLAEAELAAAAGRHGSSAESLTSVMAASVAGIAPGIGDFEVGPDTRRTGDDV